MRKLVIIISLLLNAEIKLYSQNIIDQKVWQVSYSLNSLFEKKTYSENYKLNSLLFKRINLKTDKALRLGINFKMDSNKLSNQFNYYELPLNLKICILIGKEKIYHLNNNLDCCYGIQLEPAYNINNTDNKTIINNIGDDFKIISKKNRKSYDLGISIFNGINYYFTKDLSLSCEMKLKYNHEISSNGYVTINSKTNGRGIGILPQKLTSVRILPFSFLNINYTF